MWLKKKSEEKKLKKKRLCRKKKSFKKSTLLLSLVVPLGGGRLLGDASFVELVEELECRLVIGLGPLGAASSRDGKRRRRRSGSLLEDDVVDDVDLAFSRKRGRRRRGKNDWRHSGELGGLGHRLVGVLLRRRRRKQRSGGRGRVGDDVEGHSHLLGALGARIYTIGSSSMDRNRSGGVGFFFLVIAAANLGREGRDFSGSFEYEADVAREQLLGLGPGHRGLVLGRLLEGRSCALGGRRRHRELEEELGGVALGLERGDAAVLVVVAVVVGGRRGGARLGRRLGGGRLRDAERIEESAHAAVERRGEVGRLVSVGREQLALPSADLVAVTSADADLGPGLFGEPGFDVSLALGAGAPAGSSSISSSGEGGLGGC